MGDKITVLWPEGADALAVEFTDEVVAMPWPFLNRAEDLEAVRALGTFRGGVECRSPAWTSCAGARARRGH
ncbi:MAG: hypothetical protein C0617_16365 [Desulfuromonas sp.]|nr:MAG: hypothetical protein C0617_16365 [Desulfuromonas sp.]